MSHIMADVNNRNCNAIKLSELQFDNSHINQLDDDCLLEIFSYFTIEDILHVEKVCKRWERLCEESWKRVETLQCVFSDCYLAGKDFENKLYKITCQTELKKILKRCGKFIKYFKGYLEGFGQLTTVTELCRNLLRFEIDSDYKLSAIEIRSIRRNCKNIKTLELRNFDAALEKDLSELVNNTKSLEYFSLIGSYGIDISGEFLLHLPLDIMEIYLQSTQSLKSHFVVSAMKQFTNLRVLQYVPYGVIDDSIMKAIGEKKTLIKLSIIKNSYQSSKSFKYLANLTNLEELHLNHNKQLRDDNLINILNNCKQLKSLEIIYCHEITNRGIASVAKLKQLKVLYINGLNNVSDEAIGDLPDSLEYLSCHQCKKITKHGVMKLLEKAPHPLTIGYNGTLLTNNIINK